MSTLRFYTLTAVVVKMTIDVLLLRDSTAILIL